MIKWLSELFFIDSIKNFAVIGNELPSSGDAATYNEIISELCSLMLKKTFNSTSISSSIDFNLVIVLSKIISDL